MGSRAVPHVNVHRAALPKVARVGCVQGGPSTRGAAQTCSWLCVYVKKKKQDKDSQSNARRIEILFLFFNKSGECPNQFTFFKSQLNCKDVSEQIGMDPKIKICQ